MKAEKLSILNIMDSVLIMSPKPSPYRLRRIGGKHDGAYLVPDDLGGIDACFSPGVNNVKSFEDELADVFGIKCHMCDFSGDFAQLETPLIEGMQTFKKKWLDIDGGADSITLEDWIQELSPAVDIHLILQMDIEGAEYRNLLNCKNSVLKRCRIIVLEVHGLHVANDVVEFEKEIGPSFRKIDKSFVCIHAYPNNCCGDFMLAETGLNVPNTHELTFLRRDRFDLVNASDWHKPLIPHPLDISFNMRIKPPSFLNKAWCSNGSRDLSSRIEMTKTQLDYLAFRFITKAKRKIKSLLPFRSGSI